MKKLFWILPIFALLILSGCWLTNTIQPSQTDTRWTGISDNVNTIDYSEELMVAWVGPEITFEQTIAGDTLVLKKTFEDHSDHIFFPRQSWSNYLDIQEDAIPWNHVKFIGKVQALDVAVGNHYYEVVSINELVKTAIPSEAEVLSLLNTYGYCETDADCTSIYGKCPLPCHIGINAKFSWIVEKIIDNFRNGQTTQCTYKCMEIKSVKCNAYKCEVK